VTNSKLLPYVVEVVSAQDPKLGARLHSQISAAEDIFRRRAEDFFGRYQQFINGEGKDISFGIHCFLELQRGVEQQRIQFLKTGKYQNTSFAAVEQSVYSNPAVMEQYMHGLVFAQFLWPDQYHRFQFFCDHLPEYADKIERYLEIGGGHALYVTEADSVLDKAITLDVVDISATSLQMARGIARAPRVHFELKNVFDFEETVRYDFITMGEVLEHVEQPGELLAKIRRLLAPGGRAYITTPANAPMIDHIYLFRNAQEIRDLLTSSGFRIERETLKYSADVNENMAARLRLPLMYAAFVA
jgi:SAM-dependent methyltransferase